MIWLTLHTAGYLTLATLASTRAVRYRRQFSAKARAREAAMRIERIARLELQLGVGLDYGRDWLVSRPVACKDYLRGLVAEGNGACEHTCWGCDKVYKPHDEYGTESGFEPTWYNQPSEQRELTDRLCRSCYLGATREDFGVVDIESIAA